ncbi:MAG: glycoside hydrolase family 88 protein [Terracidiphilus sp.]|jgi:unsaturated rhamnogalacturonyl hydrolase
MNDYRLIRWLSVVALTLGFVFAARAEEGLWSERAADAAMARWPKGRFVSPETRWAWNYELGTLLEGFDALWLKTADKRYFDYIKSSVDQFVEADGSIPTWKLEEYQLDNILLGRQLLLLYGVTQEPRYAKAATLLYDQLQHQPRTPSGGFWHKQRYPNQMWLDGLYMAEPFYAEYAATFHHPEALADIAKQFALMDRHARDPKTGLLYHGWDESKTERWAYPKTGLSSQFWARAMGWYMMALVDALDYLPEGEARAELLAQLGRDAAAVARFQDAKSGLWFQVMDRGGQKGNYLESSASCMFVYAFEKSVRRGYLPAKYASVAERGYKGILSHFIQESPGEDVTLTGTVKGAGLGGNPYRDGSYEYYVRERTATNDPKGVGAFLLASAEMENAPDAALGRGKTVLLDAWFNSQQRMDAFGQPVSFHYKWNDESNSGYSLFGHIFRDFGAQTQTLYETPTAKNLSHAQVYIIASPDIPVKNPRPNYMTAEAAERIAGWVKAGGVLVLMENDPGNADLEHFNLLAEKFGVHYNNVLRNAVTGNNFEMGRLSLSGGGPVFHAPHTIYMKEICTITPSAPARTLFVDRGDVLMATAKYGQGTVFATVDPWLYNEYTDGRKLPATYDNFGAGKELARWILAQIPPRPSVRKPASSGSRNNIVPQL